ncbi:MAG: peptidylprolyl isomerase [Candidatus Glassbacteria bacterium]|nr:peptidylprolyl isomerase [Candidatus Glassbacteria bacterium]
MISRMDFVIKRVTPFPASLLLLGMLLSCGQPPPRTGTQLAQTRDYEQQKSEREVWIFETDLGEFMILPMPQAAPTTVRQIKNLIQRGFYDGLTFHYVEKDGLIQGGDVNSRDDDPTNDGAGDPGFTIAPEFNMPNMTGNVGLAHPPGEPDKGNSQFYILLEDRPQLNGRFTVFGVVVEGFDVIRDISRSRTDENGQPVERVEIRRVYVDERYV